MKILFGKQIIFLLILLFPLLTKAQLVKESFNTTILDDQFNEDKGNWRSISNTDNLFITQDGQYLLRRRNTENAFSIFTSWKNSLSEFLLIASMKLDDSKNPAAYTGIIFMAQAGGQGAFVAEFNAQQQYRLRQLVGVKYKLITGNAKNSGWIHADTLNPAGQFNVIEVRTSKRNYDLYINHKFMLSFTELAYKTGEIGFTIGPATKASVDFIKVLKP
jgi:hypothetical protein